MSLSNSNSIFDRLYKINKKGNRIVWEIYVKDDVVEWSYSEDDRKTVFRKTYKVGKEAATQAVLKIKRKKKIGYISDKISIRRMSFDRPITLIGNCFLQPKLAGLRCISFFRVSEWLFVDKNKMVFRYDDFSVIKKDLDAFDKNLIYDGVLSQTTDKVVYTIFDLINDESQYVRLEKLYTMTYKIGETVKIIETIEISDPKDIYYVHDMFKKAGHSGTIIRYKYGFYEDNTSHYCFVLE